MSLPVSVLLSAMRTPVKKGPVRHPVLLRIVSSPFGDGFGKAIRGGPLNHIITMPSNVESKVKGYQLTSTTLDSFVDMGSSSGWRLIRSPNPSEGNIVADSIGLGIDGVVELA